MCLRDDMIHDSGKLSYSNFPCSLPFFCLVHIIFLTKTRLIKSGDRGEDFDFLLKRVELKISLLDAKVQEARSPQLHKEVLMGV